MTGPGPDLGSVTGRPAVSVLVPRRPDGGPRDRAWEWLRPRWLGLGWQVIEGIHTDGLWCKAVAVQDALARASGNILVIADADVWCEGVTDAVGVVRSGEAVWAVPHTLVHRLTKGATDVLYGTEMFGGPLIEQRVEQRPYVGMIGGGCVVLPRSLYAGCPLDPRFQGWGQEDQAWGIALTALYGQPWRSPRPCWHLWHPPQDRMSRSTGSMAGRRLCGEYVAAADRGDMAGWLAQASDEARETTKMWKYRNRNSGDVHELPAENARLSRLPNWELIERPAPVPLDPSDFRSAEPVPAPEPQAVPVPVVAVFPDPVVVAPVEPEPPLPAEAATVPPLPGDMDLTAAPKLYASKAEWVSYARMRGVPGCDGMTKAQLVRACR